MGFDVSSQHVIRHSLWQVMVVVIVGHTQDRSYEGGLLDSLAVAWNTVHVERVQVVAAVATTSGRVPCAPILKIENKF